MLILGIAGLFHDSSACLVEDGDIVVAIQEERLSREKHDSRFPINSISSVLETAGATADALDHVAFYEKPHLKFERIVSTYRTHAPEGFETFQQALPLWLGTKLWTPTQIRDAIIDLSPTHGEAMRWDGRTIFPEHHMSHAASAYYPSPFKDAAILTMDGVGEWATTTIAVGEHDSRAVPRIRFLKEIRYPDSLGMLYSAFTSYLGFKVNSGEYKVMGLAPYGEPHYSKLILDEVIDLRDDGSFQLNLDYFTFPYSMLMVNEKFADLFGLPPRPAETFLTQEHLDVAASIQKVLEHSVERLAEHARLITGKPRLCMAGGVALNCVATGIIHRKGIFDDIWIQPAAGDAGGAIGAALHVWHDVMSERRVGWSQGADLMHGAFLGPSFDHGQITEALVALSIPFAELNHEEVTALAAEQLAAGQVIGWFQGRMEFGPRALGARSILGDPRSPVTQKMMNLKIKYRESFRPFAPAVLREHVDEWFDLNGHSSSILGGPSEGYDSPYMLLVAPVAESRIRPMTPDEERLFGIDKLNIARSDIPACTHVDYSARIQTVSKEENPRFHELITKFYEKTGVPVVVNTSFNVRGEPIVCTPRDAIRCFLGTELDALFLENFVVQKHDIPDEAKVDYKHKFELD